MLAVSRYAKKGDPISLLARRLVVVRARIIVHMDNPL